MSSFIFHCSWFYNITSAKLISKQREDATKNLCKKWDEFCKKSNINKNFLRIFLAHLDGCCLFVRPTDFKFYHQGTTKVSDIFEKVRKFMKSKNPDKNKMFTEEYLTREDKDVIDTNCILLLQKLSRNDFGMNALIKRTGLSSEQVTEKIDFIFDNIIYQCIDRDSIKPLDIYPSIKNSMIRFF